MHSIEKFLKLAGIFVGLTVLTFLSLLIGLGKITLPQSVTDGEGSRTLSVRATSSIPAATPVSPPSQVSPVKNTTKVPVSRVTLPPPPAKSSVSTPGALIAPPNPPSGGDNGGVPDKSGALNQNDITMLTNVERTKEGLGSLVFSSRLASMAATKARDMINKQYFAHVSPDGTDVTKLAANVDYSYLNLGENLALGDFRSSDDVVTGWMNSPGHRANILNKNFTEIGVAAIMGNYEGRMVWYAVQEFGRPMPNCPKPDAELEQKIALSETQITAIETTLANLRAEIEAAGADQETYDTKAKEYNTLVEVYNGLITNVKADITTYNSEAQTYNSCIGS